MQRIIAIANQKGGSAKTTTTACVGAGIAATGKKVLLVDMDPQGNLGQNFGLSPQTIDNTIADVLFGKLNLADVASEVRKNLFLVPSNTDLAGAEIDLNGQKAKEFRLQRALTTASGFDYVLLDCPPNLGNLTVNALTAAGEVMIPLPPEKFAISGFQLLETTIDEIRNFTNSSLAISGVIVTRYRSNVNLHRDIAALVKERYPDLLFQTYIPETIRLAESQTAVKTIFEFEPGGPAAVAYKALCKEIIKRGRISQ